ncbi:hypothetical protein [Nostoc sp. C110]
MGSLIECDRIFTWYKISPIAIAPQTKANQLFWLAIYAIAVIKLTLYSQG